MISEKPERLEIVGTVGSVTTWSCVEEATQMYSPLLKILFGVSGIVIEVIRAPVDLSIRTSRLLVVEMK
jgi:hypothetical protein